MSADDAELLTIDGQQVRISHPEKLYFSQQVKVTKLDLVCYYLSVTPGALSGIRDRPIVLKRFVNGAEAEPFYQKRAPSDKPAWMRTVTLSFPSGRTAEEIVVDDAAGLAWIVNLGCMELHPHPVRTANLDHPDELRVDLDPIPGVGWDDVRRVAMEVKSQLEDVGLLGWPKTSGSRGIHINVRIHPRWSFTEVRRAALALSRAVERRIPQLASSKWWKEERHGVFLDYNQNAKDRTTCSAYSVRPLPDARVSTPLAWDEVMTCEPADFTLFTVPERFQRIGDPHAAMDNYPGSLDALLDLAARDEASGLGDAPWPPHFRKAEGEGARVAPSRAKKEKSFAGQMKEGFGEHRFRKRAKTLEAASGSEGDPAATTETSEAGTQKPRRTRASSQPRSRLSSSRSHRTKPQLKPGSSAGGRHILKPQPCSPSTMSSSIACAEPPASGIASASTSATCPKSSDLRKRSLTLTTIPRASGVNITPPIRQQCRSARERRRVHRPLAKMSASSCGATTSSCAYVHSCGALSVRQRRNCAMWRKRVPCMCSYATSTTSSGRSGCHERSLPWLQRD
jgi:DNA ligase D-like protein (predicted polymerase)